jgi:hypothetical protein
MPRAISSAPTVSRSCSCSMCWPSRIAVTSVHCTLAPRRHCRCSRASSGANALATPSSVPPHGCDTYTTRPAAGGGDGRQCSSIVASAEPSSTHATASQTLLLYVSWRRRWPSPGEATSCCVVMCSGTATPATPCTDPCGREPRCEITLPYRTAIDSQPPAHSQAQPGSSRSAPPPGGRRPRAAAAASGQSRPA